MKTIREWLNELPDFLRKRALANEIHKTQWYPWDGGNYRSIQAALYDAFYWSETLEGNNYWKKVNDALCHWPCEFKEPSDKIKGFGTFCPKFKNWVAKTEISLRG